jgi:hypothetical protein
MQQPDYVHLAKPWVPCLGVDCYITRQVNKPRVDLDGEGPRAMTDLGNGRAIVPRVQPRGNVGKYVVYPMLWSRARCTES